VRGDRSAAPASYQFAQLSRDLYRMGPTMRRRLRAEFERAGQATLSDARSRAGAWSSQIPSAIQMRPISNLTTGQVGVELRVSKSVRHARPYEGISQQGSLGHFRHPVYGNTKVWRSQETRPYLRPAVQGRAPALRRAVEQAVENAARECGFR
jgi:hypothetical protein